MTWLMNVESALDELMRRNRLWVAPRLPDLDKTQYQVWGMVADGRELNALTVCPINANALIAGKRKSVTLTAFLDFDHIHRSEKLVFIVQAAEKLTSLSLQQASVLAANVVPVILVGDVLQVAACANRIPYFMATARFCMDAPFGGEGFLENAS